MTRSIEISDELQSRIAAHLDDDQTEADFIEELLNVYETEGIFLQEGYSE